MKEILPYFWKFTELYHTLTCLLLGVSVATIPDNMTLELMESFVIFKAPEHHILTIDSLYVIFAMLRSSYEFATEEKKSKVVSKIEDESQSEAVRIQGAVLQFLLYLFGNCNELQEHCRSKTDLFEDLISIVYQENQSTVDVHALNDENGPPQSGKINETIVLVFDFLCQIIDSSFRSHVKGFSLLENMIEVSPYSEDDTAFNSLQSKMLADLIYLFDSNTTKKDFYENSKLVGNISKFVGMIVDKTYQSMFNNSPRVVFEFLVHTLEKLDDDSICILLPNPRNTFDFFLNQKFR